MQTLVSEVNATIDAASPTKCHIGEVGAVVGTGRIPHARDLFPLGSRNCGKCVSPSGRACTSVISRRSARVHPLRIDFRAADDRDLSGETPQRIAGGDRPGVGKGSGDHGAAAR